MTQVLVHPELIALFNTLYVADLDYEDNRGSHSASEFATRARRAQTAFRERKEELEAEGTVIWGDDGEDT